MHTRIQALGQYFPILPTAAVCCLLFTRTEIIGICLSIYIHTHAYIFTGCRAILPHPHHRSHIPPVHTHRNHTNMSL